MCRTGRGKRIVLLASQVHPSISRALIRGATRVLRAGGVSRAHMRLVWVPGAFELPVVAARIAKSRHRPHAIIALGALIRGETPQYAVLARAVAQGLTEVAVRTGIPVTFGVIVATTLAQANARAGLFTPPRALLRPVTPLLSCESKKGGPGLNPGNRSAISRGKAKPGGQVGKPTAHRGEEAARAALEVLRLFN